MVRKAFVKKLLLSLVVSSGITSVPAISASASVGNDSFGSTVATANPITASNQTTSDDSGQPIGTLKYKIEGDTLILSGGGMKSEDSLNPDSETGFTPYPWSEPGSGITKVKITGPVKLEGVAPRDLFYNMISLTTFEEVGNGSLNTSEATDMSNMFGTDFNLTKLDLSGFNTSKVTSMSGMFMLDQKLTSLDVSSFDTSIVTDMSNMFSGDSALISLNASGLDTSSVTDDNMSGMFTGDTKLWQLTLGDKTGNEILSSLEEHSSKTEIPDSKPVHYASGPGWQAVHPENDTSSGTVTDPKGTTYATRDAFVATRPLERNTYVWQQPASPVTSVVPSNNGTSDAIISSSDSTSSSSSSVTLPSQAGTSSSDGDVTTNTVPDYAMTKETVVYAIKKIGLYQSVNFTSAKRKAWYAKEPRIYRPMFVVTGYKRSKNGALRYQVKDVNHGSKADGKTGYITANQKYVRLGYYATKHSVVTVINPHGINAYRKANQTRKVKSYRQGAVLHVKGIIQHHLTTRYILTNGDYITANRKLVSMGRYKQVRSIRTKQAINRYRDVNFNRKNKSIARGRILKVYGYNYSYGYNTSKHGALRYRVAGGYVTANAKYVRGYK